MSIEIKVLSKKHELHAMEQLQAAVWSENSVIPLHMTLTIAKFGGIFLGAYEGSTMIGFLYSFPGFTNGESHLCSHMLGFLPSYRKNGLGVKMKWVQREEALRLGHSKITWTYDPLESVNAYLNIAKLGGIVRSYLPNCYGELNDDMNRGLPTDRFLVEWLIDSEHVMSYAKGEALRSSISPSTPSVLHYDLHLSGIPYPTNWVADVTAPTITCSVPAHFQQIKQQDMQIAKSWRDTTGQLFLHYFSKGYVITDVIRDKTKPVITYVLEKGNKFLFPGE